MSGITFQILLAKSSPPRTLTSISGATGTNIGDLTAQLGLAGSFDGLNTAGDYRQTAANSSGSVGAVSAAYVGKTYSSGKAPAQAIIWPSTNGWFFNNGGLTGTLDFYVKNGVPANGTDGTIVGTTGSFADENTVAKTINIADAGISYTNWWIRFSSNGSSAIWSSEVQFSEWV